MNKTGAFQLNIFETNEQQTRPANGNHRMVNYGIQNDMSNFRVHVGYKAQHIYVFPTEEGRLAIDRKSGHLQKKNGGQPGVIGDTFKGFAIPVSSIDGIQSILIPHDIYVANVITKEGMTTSAKGIRAVRITMEMLKRNLIHLPLNIAEINDASLQIKGGDIIIESNLILQVKCDFLAGERKHGGTGNVFLQTDECNPRRFV